MLTVHTESFSGRLHMSWDGPCRRWARGIATRDANATERGWELQSQSYVVGNHQR